MRYLRTSFAQVSFFALSYEIENPLEEPKSSSQGIPIP